MTPTGDGAATAELDRAGAKIEITRATYSVTYAVLTVQATYAGVPSMTRPVLSVYDDATNKPIGTMQTKNGSSYFGSFTLKSSPQMIWVADTNGQRADAKVEGTK